MLPGSMMTDSRQSPLSYLEPRRYRSWRAQVPPPILHERQHERFCPLQISYHNFRSFLTPCFSLLDLCNCEVQGRIPWISTWTCAIFSGKIDGGENVDKSFTSSFANPVFPRTPRK